MAMLCEKLTQFFLEEAAACNGLADFNKKIDRDGMIRLKVKGLRHIKCHKRNSTKTPRNTRIKEDVAEMIVQKLSTGYINDAETIDIYKALLGQDEHDVHVQSLTVRLPDSRTEEYLSRVLDMRRFKFVKKLLIHHATHNEVLNSSFFMKMSSTLRCLYIHGPGRVNTTISSSSVRAISEIEQLLLVSLRNIDIGHLDYQAFLTYVGSANNLYSTEMQNIRCIDHLGSCEGLNFVYPHKSQRNTLNISYIPVTQMLFHFDLGTMEKLTRITDRLSNLHISFSSQEMAHIFFTTAWHEMIELLKNLSHLKFVELQTMTIGSARLQNIRLDRHDINDIVDWKKQKMTLIQMCVYKFGNTIISANTSLTYTDFQAEKQKEDSFADSLILALICYQLKLSCDDLLEAYASGQERPILQCFFKPDYSSKSMIKDYRGFDVRVRKIENISKLAIVAENSAVKQTELYKRVALKKFAGLHETMLGNMNSLLTKHSNIEGIRISFVKSCKGIVIVCPCVVIYCLAKDSVPYKELQFPKELKHPSKCISYEVDVREGYFSVCPDVMVTKASIELHQELAMGCSVGEKNERVSATAGPIVCVSETNEVCFLTAQHTFHNKKRTNKETIGIKVVQPSDMDIRTNDETNRECGVVVACRLGGRIDAALVKICSDRIPSDAHFSSIQMKDLQKAGFQRIETPPQFDGLSLDIDAVMKQVCREGRIIKVGAETGLTVGKLSTTSGFVRDSSEYMTLESRTKGGLRFVVEQQMFIEAPITRVFAQSGDSGSAVFYVDENDKLYCIGMVIGIMSDSLCIVTPIKNILDDLGNEYGKKLQLKRFR